MSRSTTRDGIASDLAYAWRRSEGGWILGVAATQQELRRTMCRGVATWENRANPICVRGCRPSTLINRLPLARALTRAREYQNNPPSPHCSPSRAQNCKWPRRGRALKPLPRRAVRESMFHGGVARGNSRRPPRHRRVVSSVGWRCWSSPLDDEGVPIYQLICAQAASPLVRTGSGLADSGEAVSGMAPTSRPYYESKFALNELPTEMPRA